MEEKPKNISKPGLRWFWIISVGYQVILLATLVCIVLYTTKLTHQVKILREKSVNNNEMRSHGQSATKVRHIKVRDCFESTDDKHQRNSKFLRKLALNRRKIADFKLSD